MIINPPSIKPFHNSTLIKSINIPTRYYNGPEICSLYNVPIVKALPYNKVIKQVKIAIIVAFTYPDIKADLQTYWQSDINYGSNSAPPNITVYTWAGATQNAEWAQEECLDVQMVCAINPNADIYVVEAKSSFLNDMLNAVDYAVNVINADILSMSWGVNDMSLLNIYKKHFTNSSKCYCAASGDSNIVSWPSVVSSCISVGGTSLEWSPTIEKPFNRKEYTWTSSGSGYSLSNMLPKYQNKLKDMIPKGKNGLDIKNPKRFIPDVSLIANPSTGVYGVYAGNWYVFGGTSVSTAIFSAILSIANQKRFNIGKKALTTVYSELAPLSNNIQNYLYKTVYTNEIKYRSNFYDVIIGTNVGTNPSGGSSTYNTLTGYDIPTGLGSPNCKQFCVDLSNGIL